MEKEPLVGVSAWRLVTPRLNPACFERRQLLPIKNDQNSQCQKKMVNRRTCRGYQSQAGNFSCITTVVLKSFTLAWKSCKLDINAMKENKSPFGTNHYNCKTEIATIQGSLKYCAQLVKFRKWPGCFATIQWNQNLSTQKRLCVETFGLVRYCHAGDLLEDHILTLLPFLIAYHPLNCVLAKSAAQMKMIICQQAVAKKLWESCWKDINALSPSCQHDFFVD